MTGGAHPYDRQRSFMSPHRPNTFASLIALTAALVATSLGLTACGGSSTTTTTTTTTQTAANAAATGTTGTTTASTTTAGAGASGSTSTGTSSTPTTPGASTTATPPAARAAHFAAVRTCLSKKGITLPQHKAGGFAGGTQLPPGMSRAQFADALRSCGGGFKGGRFGKGTNGFKNPYNDPHYHAVLARLAACLRQNGVNVGEPNTSGKGPVFNTKGLNTGSPQFKAAMAACRYTLLGALKSKAHPGAATAG
jgi:hypothetical protein